MEQPEHDWYSCPHCGRHWIEDDLFRIEAKKAEREARYEAKQRDREILECFREDQFRQLHKRGGGRSGKSYGKDDKLRGTTLKPFVDEAIQWTSSRSMDPRDKTLSVRWGDSPPSSDQMRAAIERFRESEG